MADYWGGDRAGRRLGPVGVAGLRGAAEAEMFGFPPSLRTRNEQKAGGPAPAEAPARAEAPPPPKAAPTYDPSEFIGWERRTDNRVYCEVHCTIENAAKIFNA